MIKVPSSYTIKTKKGKSTPFIRFIVIPLTIIALLFLVAGIYSFVGANRIMRTSPLGLDNFPNNILPSYRNASFASLDGLTDLSGWYFTTPLDPVSTVIMVHGHESNRLQYGTETVGLYDFFVKQGFNVLSFDLRHSGDSSGNITAFGYSEWQDVLGAISYVKRVSATTDVILYGFGSGVGASLIAMDNLPPKGKVSDDYAYNIQILGYDRSYIRGLILDCPMVSPDDYIREVCRNELFLGRQIAQYTVPYAVRLSAGNEKKHNLAAILTRFQIPVHIIYGNYSDEYLKESADVLASERARMFPEQTTLHYIGEDGNQVNALTSELADDDGYIGSISQYLNRFILLAP
ncbi:MAG: alpha/beta hydrolase [Saccharofermentanales bacterium]